MDTLGLTGLDPSTIGLLSAAAAGLEASGPSRTPVSLGQVMSRGLLGGMNAYQGAQDQEMKRGLLGMQMQHMKNQDTMLQAQLAEIQRKAAQDELIRRARAGIFGDPGVSPEQALQGGGGPTLENAARIRAPNPMAVNQAGLQNYLAMTGDTKMAEALQNMGARGTLGKIDPKDYTPESFSQYLQSNNPATLRPRSRVEVTRSGHAYDPYATAPGTTFSDPNKPFNIGTGGQIVPNTAFQNYETNKTAAGATRVNQSVNTGAKAFETELGKLDAEQLGKMRAAAEAANSTLRTVQNLRSSIDEGVFSGGGAQAKAAVSNLVSGLTGAQIKNLPGSQLFNSEASTLILDRIKSLGANPSNADREFLEKTIPNLSMDPKARDALITYMENVARRNISAYQAADEYARKNSGLGGFNILQNGSDVPAGWRIQRVRD